MIYIILKLWFPRNISDNMILIPITSKTIIIHTIPKDIVIDINIIEIISISNNTIKHNIFNDDIFRY